MATDTADTETDEVDTDEVDTTEAATAAADLHGCPSNTSTAGEALVHATPDQLIDLASALVEDGFSFLVDVTVVDYLSHPGRVDLPTGVVGERFELVVSLLDRSDRRRLRIRVQIPESDPKVPSLFDLFPGSEAREREAFDMFGIEFENHPDPTRILMPEDWVGHPLRKDYGIGSIPVQFKSSDAGR